MFNVELKKQRRSLIIVIVSDSLLIVFTICIFFLYNVCDLDFNFRSCHLNINVEIILNSYSFDSFVEFAFCNAYEKKTVRDLTVKTENWPAPSITNPTCECTFAVEDPESHYLTGYAHCNVGSITKSHTMG